MNSFISWIGGKKLLREKILEQFPESNSFDRYIEVFGGAGWVLFSRDRHARIEVYNDVNSNLVNLYRCVKYHPEELQKELDGLLMSRELFFDMLQETRGLTDIQRAARFFTVIKESFGTDCHSFGIRPRNLQKAVDFITMASGRLQSVVIENVDFEHLISTYDSPKALFYLDPPYYEAEKYYPDRFQPEDHDRLKHSLDNIKGKFVLSYNDCLQIQDMYKEYNIISVDRNDNLSPQDGGRRYREVIIKNF